MPLTKEQIEEMDAVVGGGASTAVLDDETIAKMDAVLAPKKTNWMQQAVKGIADEPIFIKPKLDLKPYSGGLNKLNPLYLAPFGLGKKVKEFAEWQDSNIKKGYEQLTGFKESPSEFLDRTIPAPTTVGGKVAYGLGALAPLIPEVMLTQGALSSTAIPHATSVLARIGIKAPALLNNIVRSGTAVGAVSGLQSSARGESAPEVAKNALLGAGTGMFLPVAGRAGSMLLPSWLPFAERLGGGLVMGGASALMAPKGEKLPQAIIGTALGTAFPQTRRGTINELIEMGGASKMKAEKLLKEYLKPRASEEAYGKDPIGEVMNRKNLRNSNFEELPQKIDNEIKGEMRTRDILIKSPQHSNIRENVSEGSRYDIFKTFRDTIRELKTKRSPTKDATVTQLEKYLELFQIKDGNTGKRYRQKYLSLKDMLEIKDRIGDEITTAWNPDAVQNKVNATLKKAYGYINNQILEKVAPAVRKTNQSIASLLSAKESSARARLRYLNSDKSIRLADIGMGIGVDALTGNSLAGGAIALIRHFARSPEGRMLKARGYDYLGNKLLEGAQNIEKSGYYKEGNNLLKQFPSLSEDKPIPETPEGWKKGFINLDPLKEFGLAGNPNKFMRGNLNTSVGNTLDNLAKSDPNLPILKGDGGKSIAEVLSKTKNIKYLEPTVSDKKQNLRYKADEQGLLGNAKMRFENEAYPSGRNTYDAFGCGRGQFCRSNDLESKACYGGACYADAQGRTKGRNVLTGEATRGLRKESDTYKSIKAMWEEGGRNIEAVKDAFPEYNINYYPKEKNFSVTVKSDPKGATVFKKLQNAKGQDIRLGVDSDGSAWLANKEVLDGLAEANPRHLSVYSSAYHTPPKPHPLSNKTIVNVTVSGWHPLSETLSRIRWAEESRKNGWNTILRVVTADPAQFPDLAQKYNRIIPMIEKSDFLYMEQPLHVGQKHGKSIMSGGKAPSCCVGSAKNPQTCHKCKVAEGLGSYFKEFWEDKLGKKLPPAFDEGKSVQKKNEILSGININDKTQPFTEQILSGAKTIETRNSRSLDPYVGKRVGLVKTGKGDAMLVGYADIGSPKEYKSVSAFRADENKHLVAKNSAFDIKGGLKYGYPISNVEKITPTKVKSKGIVSRKLVRIK